MVVTMGRDDDDARPVSVMMMVVVMMANTDYHLGQLHTVT